MRIHATRPGIAICLTLMSAGPIFSQTVEPNTEAGPTPVAHVYVQTTRGVMVFSAAANGKLTSINGSPYPVSGQIGGISGKYLISVGTDLLHTYLLKSNGGVGGQVAVNNSQDYGGSECGNNTYSTSVFDHTGRYFYLQLDSDGTCAAMQSYKLEPDGSLVYRGNQEYDVVNDGVADPSINPTFASNDVFAYGEFAGEFSSNTFAAYTKVGGGVLNENTHYSQVLPECYPNGYEGGDDWTYHPIEVAAAPSNYLAATMLALESGYGWDGTYRVASFTINPSSGAISSGNSYSNMPYLAVGYPLAMNSSPSGLLTAVGGSSGVQFLDFNQSQPLADLSGQLLPGIEIDQLAWDYDNHLYAVSFPSNGLYVFTVTPHSFSQAPGSPYHLPHTVYANPGLVVTR